MNFPGIPVFGNIDNFKAHELRGSVDIVCGGFPCQPFSLAGNQQATSDDRHKWPEMLRIITECRPPIVIGENVLGIATVEDGEVLHSIQTDLETEGYEVRLFNIPASSVEAPHQRQRIWIIGFNANSYTNRCDSESYFEKKRFSPIHWERQLLSRISSRTDTITSNDARSDDRRYQPKQIERQTQQLRNCSFKAFDFNALHGEAKRYRRNSGEVLPNCQSENSFERFTYSQPWTKVASILCRVDDGLPDWMDERDKKTIYKAVAYLGREETEKRIGIDLRKVEDQVQRKNRLKAMGNSVHVHLVYEIFDLIDKFLKTIV